ncbi:hypothetical protein ACHQM5_006023 [Ranunculus cassubicifolius]
MAVRIRLARLGCRNRPFYRVVATDSKNRRDGKQIEVLGYYDPLPANDDAKRMGLKIDRIKYWLSVGAQPSDTVRSILFMNGVLPPEPVVAVHKSGSSNIIPNDTPTEYSATTPKDNSDTGGYGNDASEEAENLTDNSHLWYNIGVQISPSGFNQNSLLQP